MKEKCNHDVGYYTKTKATQYLYFDENGEAAGGDISYHSGGGGEVRYCQNCKRKINSEKAGL